MCMTSAGRALTPAEAAEARGARPTGERAGGLRKYANGEEQRMNSFKNCLKRAKKRPGLFAFVALATLALTIVEQYNSWTRQYAHFSTFKGFDYVAFLNDLATNINEMAFDYLDAPPVVVGAKNWITPAYEFDADFFPQTSWILDAIDQKIMPLKGHTTTPNVNYTTGELMRIAKKGV